MAATIAEVRANADAWFTAKDKIAVCGFSAGGHLAASLGTLFNEEKFLQAFGREADIRPDAMILGYPVIVADEFAHVGSISKVSGAEVGSGEYAWFGLDKHVDDQTPPTFMWHTAEDKAVPVENSIKMAAEDNFRFPPCKQDIKSSVSNLGYICFIMIGQKPFRKKFSKLPLLSGCGVNT